MKAISHTLVRTDGTTKTTIDKKSYKFNGNDVIRLINELNLA